MAKDLNSVQITKEFLSHIVAFSIAELGAEGNPGNIVFLTDEKELYKTSFYNINVVEDVFSKFNIINQCVDYLKNKRNETPFGWEYTELGSGNHLFMLKWLEVLFFKIVDRNALKSDIYTVWIETIMKVIDRLANKKVFFKERNNQRTNVKIVPYNAQRKNIGNNCSIRESLSAKWDSGYNRIEKIVAIGLNPSTAHDGKSDMTITKLCRFLDMYGFNNVMMLNLNESVSSKQNGMNKTSKTDFNQKKDIFDEADIILLVWGVDGYKEEKRKAMSVLSEYADKLYCIMNPKGKYPVHPSRMSYQSVLMPIKCSEDFVLCGLCGKKHSKKIEKDNEQYVMVECDLGVYLNGEFVMELGAGILAVCHFAKLVDEGIEGVTEIVRSFNCNRDVYIPGKRLLQFIEREYPQYKKEANKKVHDSDEIYKIVCFDMS